MKLDRLNRKDVKLQPSHSGAAQPFQHRPMTPGRRKREIIAIRQGNEEITRLMRKWEALDPRDLRLKLIELLNLKMVEMEVGVLRKSSKNYEETFGMPSFSRLPSFIHMVEHVLRLSKQSRSLNTALSNVEQCLAASCESLGIFTSFLGDGAEPVVRIKHVVGVVQEIQVAFAKMKRAVDEVELVHERLQCTVTQRDDAKEQHLTMARELEATREQLNILRKKMNYDNQRFKEERVNFENLQKQFTEDHADFQEKMEKHHKRVDILMIDCEKYQSKNATLENEKRVLEEEIDRLKLCCSNEDDEETKVRKLLSRLQNNDIYLQEIKSSHERELEECKERSKKWQDRLLSLENQQSQIIGIKDEHIRTLTDAFNSIDPSFEKVLRAEMQALKQSYELKVETLESEKKQSTTTYKQQIRSLKSQMKDDKRCWEGRVKLLLSLIHI